MQRVCRGETIEVIIMHDMHGEPWMTPSKAKRQGDFCWSKKIKCHRTTKLRAAAAVILYVYVICMENKIVQSYLILSQVQ